MVISYAGHEYSVSNFVTQAATYVGAVIGIVIVATVIIVASIFNLADGR